MRDALTERSRLCKLSIGMDLVVVTRQPGEVIDGIFAHRARKGRNSLPNRKFFEIKSSHSNLLV